MSFEIFLFLSSFAILSKPQVFEQSLFLFQAEKAKPPAISPTIHSHQSRPQIEKKLPGEEEEAAVLRAVLAREGEEKKELCCESLSEEQNGVGKVQLKSHAEYTYVAFFVASGGEFRVVAHRLGRRDRDH